VARHYLATQDIVYDRLAPAEQAAILRAVETALADWRPAVPLPHAHLLR
jgi:hypothetical protein